MAEPHLEVNCHKEIVTIHANEIVNLQVSKRLETNINIKMKDYQCSINIMNRI